MVLKKIKKINIMEKNIMNTKKEIRNFLNEYYSDSARGTLKSRVYNRDIYLTDEDYVKVKILTNYGVLIIAMFLDNSKSSVVYDCGLTTDLNGIWRRFQKRFKGYIAQSEYFECDKYMAKLKEVYSLL